MTGVPTPVPAAAAARDGPDPATAEGRVIVIGGPTASGKSSVAVELARALDGTVINADSMQVYRELAIVTARPTRAQTDRVPHRLYGTMPAAEPCSAARWRDAALAEIAAALAEGRTPIVVGGTGLYLRALVEGIAEIPPVPPAVRAAAEARLAEIGGAAFRAELADRDPETAARLSDNDRQRLIRAAEVVAATGRPIAEWQRGRTLTPPPGLAFDVIALMPPRPALYAACDGRFEVMMATGAVEEVEALDALGLDPSLPAMKALGVPELRRLVRGEIGHDAAVARAQTATRRYAKRQTTWFRHQLPAEGGNVRYACAIDAQYSNRLSQEILTKIRNLD
jgi:tRNA dimethylallyltransferase